MVFVVEEEEDTSESSFAFCLNIWTPLEIGNPSSPSLSLGTADDTLAGASSVGRAVRRRNYMYTYIVHRTYSVHVQVKWKGYYLNVYSSR